MALPFCLVSRVLSYLPGQARLRGLTTYDSNTDVVTFCPSPVLDRWVPRLVGPAWDNDSATWSLLRHCLRHNADQATCALLVSVDGLFASLFTTLYPENAYDCTLGAAQVLVRVAAHRQDGQLPPALATTVRHAVASLKPWDVALRVNQGTCARLLLLCSPPDVAAERLVGDSPAHHADVVGVYRATMDDGATARRYLDVFFAAGPTHPVLAMDDAQRPRNDLLPHLIARLADQEHGGPAAVREAVARCVVVCGGGSRSPLSMCVADAVLEQAAHGCVSLPRARAALEVLDAEPAARLQLADTIHHRALQSYEDVCGWYFDLHRTGIVRSLVERVDDDDVWLRFLASPTTPRASLLKHFVQSARDPAAVHRRVVRLFDALLTPQAPRATHAWLTDVVGAVDARGLLNRVFAEGTLQVALFERLAHYSSGEASSYAQGHVRTVCGLLRDNLRGQAPVVWKSQPLWETLARVETEKELFQPLVELFFDLTPSTAAQQVRETDLMAHAAKVAPALPTRSPVLLWETLRRLGTAEAVGRCADAVPSRCAAEFTRGLLRHFQTRTGRHSCALTDRNALERTVANHPCRLFPCGTPRAEQLHVHYAERGAGTRCVPGVHRFEMQCLCTCPRVRDLYPSHDPLPATHMVRTVLALAFAVPLDDAARSAVAESLGRYTIANFALVANEWLTAPCTFPVWFEDTFLREYQTRHGPEPTETLLYRLWKKRGTTAYLRALRSLGYQRLPARHTHAPPTVTPTDAERVHLRAVCSRSGCECVVGRKRCLACRAQRDA